MNKPWIISELCERAKKVTVNIEHFNYRRIQYYSNSGTTYSVLSPL